MVSVDDAEADRTAIRLAAQRAAPGVDLHTIPDATQLFELLDGTVAPQPDLLLLDLSLDAGDGHEVLARIRSDHPTLPVVLLSGSTRPSDVARAYELGAHGFLTKPLGIRPLADLLETTFRYWCATVSRP